MPSNLLLIGFAVCFPSLLTWLYFVALAGQATAVQQGVYTVGKLIQFGLPAVWLLAVRWRAGPAAPCSAPAWRQGRGVAAGLLFGLAVAGAMLWAYHAWLKSAPEFAAAAEQIRRKVAGFGVGGLAGFVALGTFYSLVHSWLEEYYWRWFVFGRMRSSWNAAPAVALSGLAFAAHHVIVLAAYFGWQPWPAWAFSAAVALGGAVWAWLYDRTHSLLGPWLSHLLVDAAIFVIGYDLVFEAAH
jgi:membrane protease YdiL (CAAX protease family)